MNETKLSEHLEFAKSLAAEAGEIMMQYFRADELTTEWKEDNSPITIADSKINSLVIKRVKQTYPEHGIIGEEESFEPKRTTVWVLDPIDGTSCYNVGMPTSTFCLALVKDGDVQVAVVLDPFLKREFTASKGGGAFRNDERVVVSGSKDFKQMYVSPNAGDRDQPEVTLAAQEAFRALGAKVVMLPSFTYLALSLVEGKMLTAFVNYGSPWDSAAISLIVEEAGGRATDLKGNKRRYNEWGEGILLSNGLVHEQVMEIIIDANLRN